MGQLEPRGHGHGTAKGHDRVALIRRRRQPRHQVRAARPRGHQADPGLARHPADPRRDQGRVLLVPADHHLGTGPDQGVEDPVDLGPRDREDVLHPLGLQMLHQQLGSGPCRHVEFPRGLGAGEVGGRVAAEVGLEERRGPGQGQAEVRLALEPGDQPTARAVEQVPARGPVGGQEVEVIARHGQRLHVGRRPEADQGPGHVPDLELRLVRGGLDQGHPVGGPGHGAGPHAVEVAVDPDRVEQVLRRPQTIELRLQVGQTGAVAELHRRARVELGDHGVRAADLVVDLVHGAIRADLEDPAVEHDHLAVEPVERPQPEVPVLFERAHGDVAPVHPLHQRPGGRDLEERAGADLEIVRQGGGHDLVDRLARRAMACLERLPHRGRDPARERHEREIGFGAGHIKGLFRVCRGSWDRRHRLVSPGWHPGLSICRPYGPDLPAGIPSRIAGVSTQRKPRCDMPESVAVPRRALGR